MTKREFQVAAGIAMSNRSLEKHSDDHLYGCGLPDYKQTDTTLASLARHIRWQCQMLNGDWDHEELKECWRIARYRLLAIGPGSDNYVPPEVVLGKDPAAPERVRGIILDDDDD